MKKLILLACVLLFASSCEFVEQDYLVQTYGYSEKTEIYGDYWRLTRNTTTGDSAKKMHGIVLEHTWSDQNQFVQWVLNSKKGDHHVLLEAGTMTIRSYKESDDSEPVMKATFDVLSMTGPWIVTQDKNAVRLTFREGQYLDFEYVGKVECDQKIKN